MFFQVSNILYFFIMYKLYYFKYNYKYVLLIILKEKGKIRLYYFTLFSKFLELLTDIKIIELYGTFLTLLVIKIH